VAVIGEIEIDLGPVEYLREGAARREQSVTIVSQRRDWPTARLNTQIALTREQHANYFLDTIIEGPHDWPVRPVAEIFYERDVGLFRTRSALVGAIWQIQDNIAFDFGLRGARIGGQTAGEIRAGVTFAFGVTKGRIFCRAYPLSYCTVLVDSAKALLEALK
jgi:hypothetical protein